MEESRFADIIVSMPLSHSFTYAIPPAMADVLRVGARVVVSFGKRRFYSGIVYRLHTQPPAQGQIKDIELVVDDAPIVLPEQLRLWDWMSGYYLCTMGEVMRAALPSALKLESQTYVEMLAPPDNVELAALSDVERRLLDIVAACKKPPTVAELTERIAVRNPMAVLRRLVDRQMVNLAERLADRYRPKLRYYVELAPSHATPEAQHALLDELERSRATAQKRLFTELLAVAADSQQVRMPKDELMAQADVSPAALSALVKRGAVVIQSEPESRLFRYAASVRPPAPLTGLQQAAFEAISMAFAQQKTVLLHGVTSSGKTEIYIHLIAKALERGQQVLYLLPEIALTAQIINRLRRVFGDRVGVYHSKYSDAERVEIYYGVMREQPAPNQPRYDVVLGVRSSVFLPFRNLGLIIVDEEHESTYKQHNPAPRYHARDVAVMLAQMHGANVLLGSATPSVESYLNAKRGKYTLVELKARHGGVELPEIQIVDTKRAHKYKQMRSNFSTTLLDAIAAALANGEQVILFQNRRGFAQFVECAECGWVPRCEQCDVTLTYHKRGNQLVCHYCGHSLSQPTTCMACGSPNLQMRGFGTERIEDDLAIYFPDARVERLDLDSSRSRHAHERIVEQFEQGQIDILVGTQMVAKGLDFDNVGLVGIIGADAMLNFPDFRAHERSFQLMEQVSGRAGRKAKRGLVIVQTSQADHTVIQQVVQHNYVGLFEAQLAERREFLYPPYCRLVSIMLKHTNLDIAQQAATLFAQGLRSAMPNSVLGPEAPLVGRVQNLYIMEVLVKIEAQQPLARLKALIVYYADAVRRTKGMSGLLVAIDVDPV